MDPALRDLYEAELGHLRSHAREFAARDEFRALAERLGLSGGAAMRDPFVEWLLQGYAFLAARVRRKLDAEQGRFAEAVLSVVHPHLAAPTPSMLVAAFAMRPDPALLAAGALLPRGARLAMPAAARQGGARRPRRVTLTTGRAVRLWPVEVRAARYLPDAAAVAAAGGGAGAPAGVTVTLRATPAAAAIAGLGADVLDLFCAGEDAAGDALFEALAFACDGCAAAKAADGPRIGVAQLGLDRDGGGDPAAEDRTDALLPYDARSFDGWRLLHEGLALPERFRFLRLSGLRAALAGVAGPEATLVFRLSRPFPALAGRLGPESLAVNCVPAVNLFPMSLDDPAVTPRRTEHLLEPDRSDPTAYEVHSVLSVTGVGRDGAQRRFRPFFGPDGFGRGERGLRWYGLSRADRARPDLREEREAGLELYRGADAWISIVDETGRPGDPGIASLQVEALCTNRHLASHALVDAAGAKTLTCETDAGWRAIRVVAGPSPPRPGLSEGRRMWDAVNHLSLNHLSLVDAAGEPGRALAALRQLLGLYAPDEDGRAARVLAGLRGVTGRPTVRRIPPRRGRGGAEGAPMAFARGIEVALTLDDDAPSAAMLATLLDRALAGQADANGFIETVALRPDGRERLRLAPRSGTRALL